MNYVTVVATVVLTYFAAVIVHQIAKQSIARMDKQYKRKVHPLDYTVEVLSKEDQQRLVEEYHEKVKAWRKKNGVLDIRHGNNRHARSNSNSSVNGNRMAL